MEAWLKAQEVAISLNEAASLPRPSSAPLDPYAPRPSLFSSSLSTPASPVLGQAYSVTTAVAGDTGFLGQQNTGNLGQGPFRSSFLAGTCGVLVLCQRDTAPCDGSVRWAALHAGSDASSGQRHIWCYHSVYSMPCAGPSLMSPCCSYAGVLSVLGAASFTQSLHPVARLAARADPASRHHHPALLQVQTRTCLLQEPLLAVESSTAAALWQAGSALPALWQGPWEAWHPVSWGLRSA